MATYTDSLGFNKGSVGHPALGSYRNIYYEVELDFAKIAAARTAAGAAALASTDVLEVIPVPAGTLVECVGIQVLTAEGATCTIDVGDGGSASRFLNDANLNATGYSTTITQFFYTAADTIDVLINSNDTNAAKVRLFVVATNCA